MAIALAVVSTSVAISIPQLKLGSIWLKSAPLATMCVMAAALIIIFDVLTFREAMAAINVKAFLGIAASVGLGTAMEKTGVARTVAASLVSLAEMAGLGTIGVCFGSVCLQGGCSPRKGWGVPGDQLLEVLSRSIGRAARRQGRASSGRSPGAPRAFRDTGSGRRNSASSLGSMSEHWNSEL